MILQLSKNHAANIRYSKKICKFISKFITFFRKKSLLYFPPILPTASWAEFSPRYCFFAWLKW